MRKTFANAACVTLQVGLFVGVVAAAQFHGVALGQDSNAESRSMPLTLQALGVTALPRNPTVTITTPGLGMTGWRRDPITITTPALGMTGWRRDPIITITTPGLGMTGWRRDPITIATPALGMTGWADNPEECNAPFMRGACKAAEASPPPARLSDLREDIERALIARLATVSPLPAPPFDLRVHNEGPDACEAGKQCPFPIIVANVGTGPFLGPLVLRDELNLSGAQVSTTSDGWSCAAGTCVHPRSTLAPGESVTLTVDVLVPARVQRDFRLLQCAELKMPDPGDAPVRFVQLMLTAAGIDAGPADNQMGRRTRGGIEIFRRAAGLPSGSDIDEPLIAALEALMPVDRHPANDRDCAEAAVTS